MSVSALFPVLCNLDGSSRVMFVDLATLSVYESSGERVSGDLGERVISEIMTEQEAAMPKVPYEQIREVLSTERRLSKESENHIFRRRY